MKANQTYVIILFFLVLSLISSIIISVEKTSEICEIGKGCDVVQNSKYASFLGIKNSLYGMVLFSILILVDVIYLIKPKEKLRKFINIGIFIAAIISIYFLILQQFVIHNYCKFCLIVDISVISSSLLILIGKKES